MIKSEFTNKTDQPDYYSDKSFITLDPWTVVVWEQETEITTWSWFKICSDRMVPASPFYLEALVDDVGPICAVIIFH